jgi:hypothetical protein
MTAPAKRGRPPRSGTDMVMARQAILEGCSLHETSRRSRISMYMFYRLKREIRLTEVPATAKKI